MRIWNFLAKCNKQENELFSVENNIAHPKIPLKFAFLVDTYRHCIVVLLDFGYPFLATIVSVHRFALSFYFRNSFPFWGIIASPHRTLSHCLTHANVSVRSSDIKALPFSDHSLILAHRCRGYSVVNFNNFCS